MASHRSVYDNVRIGNVTAVPEPSSLFFLGMIGTATALSRMRRVPNV
ncbi:MAG: PEP-CTERM sorting domain-containing protein [Pirellulaceae bacterium]